MIPFRLVAVAGPESKMSETQGRMRSWPKEGQAQSQSADSGMKLFQLPVDQIAQRTKRLSTAGQQGQM